MVDTAVARHRVLLRFRANSSVRLAEKRSTHDAVTIEVYLEAGTGKEGVSK